MRQIRTRRYPPRHAAEEPADDGEATDGEVAENAPAGQTAEGEVSESEVTEDAPLDDEAEGDPDESATVSPITKRPVAKTRPFDGVKRATAPQRTERATDAKPDRADKGAA